MWERRARRLSSKPMTDMSLGHVKACAPENVEDAGGAAVVEDGDGRGPGVCVEKDSVRLRLRRPR